MKAFIIRLKGHELSEKVANDCISQAIKFGVSVESFDAIWGKDYLDHMQRTGLKLGDNKKTMTLGHYGNFFSHYYLWKRCLKLNEPLLILEHDGYLVRQLPEDIMENFVDILKLDCENPYADNYAQKIENNLLKPVEYIHSIEGIHKKKKLGWYTWGSYGYVIKPSGAKKLVRWVKANGFTSTDNQIADKVVTISICNPSLLRLHPLYEGKGLMKYSTTSEMGMP